MDWWRIWSLGCFVDIVEALGLRKQLACCTGVLLALENVGRSCFTLFLALFDVMLAIQIPIYVY